MNFEKLMKTTFGSREEFRRVFLPITVGAIIATLASNLFILPGGLLSGGISGIAIMIYRKLGFSYGFWYLLLNIPMALISLKFLSLKFTVQSFYVVLVVSISQMLTQGLIGILGVNDLLLNTLFGGVISGIGAGMVYRNGASFIGTDVLGMIAKKYINMNVGDFNMIINVLVLGVASLLYGIEMALYTIVSLYVGAKIGDNMMLGIGEKKNIMIITKKYEEISRDIMNELVRGVTYLDGEGAYSKIPTKVILTVVSTGQISKLRSIVNKHDLDAFMTISESMEVRGKGFRNYDNA